jgi:hypothetical protein
LAKSGEIKTGALTYKISLFGILPVGEAVFNSAKLEQFEGQSVYHLSAAASTLGFISKFFSGNAVLDSYIDTVRYNPLLFKQKLIVANKEGIDKEARYDQALGVMSIKGVRRQILPDTQDPLSAMFNLRRMDFNKVKDFEMNINSNQKNYVLNGTAEPKNIAIGDKLFRTFILSAEIKRRDKNPYHKTNITMVLLPDTDNIPVSIKVFASGIQINAKLVEIK